MTKLKGVSQTALAKRCIREADKGYCVVAKEYVDVITYQALPAAKVKQWAASGLVKAVALEALIGGEVVHVTYYYDDEGARLGNKSPVANKLRAVTNALHNRIERSRIDSRKAGGQK